MSSDVDTAATTTSRAAAANPAVAGAPASPRALHVVFRVGSAEYVLPAADVLQMESYTGATPVPGTAPHIAGVVQIRGRVVPVVDLRARFGLPPVAPTLDTRVVVGQLGARVVGLVVDMAREVVGLAAEQLAPPPSVIADRAAGFVKAVAQVSGSRLVMLLDFEKVVGQEHEDHGE